MHTRAADEPVGGWGSERGVTLILVGLWIFVLTAMSAFVLDYGVMWLSRRQAQNAADAGALAGAIARAFDEKTDPPAAGGLAETASRKAAQANGVWTGTLPDSAVEVLWDCPASAFGGTAGKGCVHVNVYRDGTNGSAALPTYFAPLLGVNSQQARATATAQTIPANATNCLRPFAVPDKWLENQTGPWDTSDTFDAWYKQGNNVLPVANPDVYTPPSNLPLPDGSPGTGYTVAVDYGTQMTLKNGQASSNIQPGWYQPIDVPRPGGSGSCSGGSCYRDNIASCNGEPVNIGDYLLTETGDKVGPTNSGVTDLIAQDPDAYWDDTNKVVAGSCAPSSTCGPFSPRIIAIAIFDPDEFQQDMLGNSWPNCPGGGSCIHVRNYIGFFVESMSGNDVVGRLMMYPGILTTSPTGVGAPSAFQIVITLVR